MPDVRQGWLGRAEMDSPSLNGKLDMPPPPTERTYDGFQYHQKAAGGGYGGWIDIRNSDATTTEPCSSPVSRTVRPTRSRCER